MAGPDRGTTRAPGPGPAAQRGEQALSRRPRLLADITPLRESAAFRRLWAGTTLSSVGGALTAFAVVLQVYDLTRSPFAVGVIGVAQMVPTLAVGLLGGPVTDAMDRRKLVLVTSSGLAAVSAALAVQAVAGLDLVWLLYALVAVQSGLGAVDRPARNTFVPSLLPASQQPDGEDRHHLRHAEETDREGRVGELVDLESDGQAGHGAAHC